MSEENQTLNCQEPSMSTIDTAIKLKELEEALKAIDQNIFQYRHQSAVDYLSTVLDLAKAFIKTDYEKSTTDFKRLNLKDLAADALKVAETLALSLTNYTQSSYQTRVQNGEIPEVFQKQRIQVQTELDTLLKNATEDPALLRNIALSLQQGTQQLLQKQQAGTQNPNADLKAKLNAELNRNNLKVVEKPLVNGEPLGFKEVEDSKELTPKELEQVGNEPFCDLATPQEPEQATQDSDR